MQEEEPLGQIELKGTVFLIYARDEDEPECISAIENYFSGQWNMGNEQLVEDFIYKKIDVPQNEELLTELFCEEPRDRILVPDLSTTFEFDPSDNKHIQDRFFSC